MTTSKQGRGGRRALLVVVAVVILYLGSAWLKARLYGSNASALVGFGCAPRGACLSELNQASLPKAAVVFKTGGYDGQFFYYIGRELFGGPAAVVDSVPFRWARIGLPVLSGPLLAAGELGRVYGLPATLLAIHLTSVWCLLLARASFLPSVLVFAFNPFSLLSFLLSTADGAALSLAVLGALLLERPGRRRFGGFALFAAALLTKETMLAVPLALAAAALFDEHSSRRVRLREILLLAATPLPMLLWWKHVGFSFGLAAKRGNFPLAGVIEYLPQMDLSRGVLAVILVFAVFAGGLLALFRFGRAAGFLLLGSAGLVSLATASEYWATIANIARLFTPMAAVPALLTERRFALGARQLWTQRLVLAWGVALLVLTALIVLREATRKPLPFFVQ